MTKIITPAKQRRLDRNAKIRDRYNLEMTNGGESSAVISAISKSYKMTVPTVYSILNENRDNIMVVYTNPQVKSLGATRISSVVTYGNNQYCIAEVPSDFNPTEDQMIESGVDFWYPVSTSFVDASAYKLRKYKKGIVYGLEEQLGLTKEINVAYGIYAVASERRANVWQVWERSIKRD